MKKMRFVGFLLLLPMLTSCEVRWGGTSYDIPWWMIALPVTVFCVIAFVLGAKWIASKTYFCPDCNRSFHPKRWNIVSIHINRSRLLRCPYCKRAGFYDISRNTEEDE